MRVGVVGHRGYAGLTDILRRLLHIAPELGLEMVFERGLHEMVDDGEALESPAGLVALLTLGGDGTMLRGARFLAGLQVPVFGVNLGRLGFLTTCGASEMESALTQFAAGSYRAEERMALEARVDGPGRTTADGRPAARHFALNDVVLAKSGYARVVRLDVAANGDSVASYAADGIVISTPTGSTAYNLSAGGPVVVPTVESILLTPISPHTLAIRPLVLPPTAEVTIRADVGPDELLVTVDGQPGTTFSAGDTLVVRRAKPVLLVRIPALGTFFSRLRGKLGWGGLAGRGEREQGEEDEGTSAETSC